MDTRRLAPLAVAAALAVGGIVAIAGAGDERPPPGDTGAGARTPVTAPEHDCPMFPPDNVWNADVSKLPTHPASERWKASMGGRDETLHPAFGPAETQPVPYGIPYEVVDGDHPKVTLRFRYERESDPGPYPFDEDTPIEGGPDATGDRHALMLDRDRCVLYELYDARASAGGATAGSGAVWDLRSNRLRPDTWTSADAAGLPILPGLVRLDELRSGVIDHAIRFTVRRPSRRYVWPARHSDGRSDDPDLPPMGARFRLRGDVDLSRFRPDTRVLLRALQRHGAILADTGPDWFLTGVAEHGWDPAMLEELKRVPAEWMEAVDMSSVVVDRDSGATRPS